MELALEEVLEMKDDSTGGNREDRRVMRPFPSFGNGAIGFFCAKGMFG